MNTAHLPSKLNGLTDLPNYHRPDCDCGRLARYALPVAIQPAYDNWQRNPNHRFFTTLYLCGRCLALEVQACRRHPLKSDKL